MKLITKDIEKKLLNASHDNMAPICKFFNPAGRGTWLITKMESDKDTLWGYADLGMDCVEFGTISLSELTNVRLPFGLKIERDLWWEVDKSKDYTTLLGTGKTLQGE